MNHIMLDIETLDTKPSAVVISIGAVAFNPATDDKGEEFYYEFADLAIQQTMGRTLSADTVGWWMQQDALARQVFSPRAKDDLMRLATVDVLVKFSEFIGRNGDKDAYIWGNGADFDNIIVGSLYESFGFKKPWSYSRNRCYRTMKDLAPKTKAVRVGTHHNALDDALTQAQHLQDILKQIRMKEEA